MGGAPVSLLEDLQAIDVSGIVDAKAAISVTVNGESLQALVGAGAAERVLGPLGEAMAGARQALDDPAALLGPLQQILGELAEAVVPDDLPIGEYVEAVSAAARLLAQLLGGLSGDLGSLTAPSGTASLADLLGTVGGPLGDYAAVAIGEVGRFRALMDTVERGIPSDPRAVVALALDVLLPFSPDPLRQLRGHVDALSLDLDAIRLDPRLIEGLLTATLRVEVAAEAGDEASLRAALDNLERVRVATVGQLAAGLRTVIGVVSRLRLDAIAGPIRAVSAGLRSAQLGAIETLAEWRSQIAEVRERITGLDLAEAMGFVDAIMDRVELEAQGRIVPEMDRLVARLEAWLRGLLRELPLRSLRHQLTLAIRAVADAIRDADLDVVVDAARDVVRTLHELIAQADLGALVADATAEIEAAVRAALDDIEAALGTVTAEVDAVADQATAVLGRAVAGLRAFRTAVDAIELSIGEAGIATATDGIVESLTSLRETAEQLLSAAPLPEALRSTIEDLASMLESVDLDAVIGEPMRAVAAELRLPTDVEGSVTSGLQAISEVVVSIIPANLTAELEAIVSDALSAITDLDIGPLTAGVTGVLDDAASFLDGVSIAREVAPAGALFDELLAQLDRVHPRVLLAPAIDVYDELLGAVPIPDPATITSRTAEVTAVAGEAVARATTEPLRRAAGGGATLAPARGASTASAADPGPPPELPPPDLRPGDIIRMIGFLPRKLREGLQALGAGPVGEVMAGIDGLLGGLADDLAAVRDRIVSVERTVVHGLDAVLAPLAPAQLAAQLALTAHAQRPGVQIELVGSLDIVARAGPASLRGELDGELRLVGERAAGALRSPGVAGPGQSVAAVLDEAIELLRACSLARLGRDLDAFLAALDPEPIALEFDAMLAALVGRVPELLTAAGEQMLAIEARVTRLIQMFNPATQAQKYLRVLTVLKEELDLVNPRRLADELAEVHEVIRGVLAAYDPRALAAELDGLIAAVAAAVRGLDPANLLPDLSGLEAQAARVTALVPTEALAGVGTQLQSVGAELDSTRRRPGCWRSSTAWHPPSPTPWSD